jgi:hypothetical protein
MLPLVALLLALHASPSPDSLVGRWQIKGDVMGNPVNELCTFAQADSVLTGSCAGEDGEPVLIAGKIEGARITFWHGGEWDGQPLTIVYSGTLASAGELKGTIEVRPMSVTGTFTAVPAPATAPAPNGATPAAHRTKP